MCIIGFINIPIIKFSVEYWNSLHQKASIIRLKGIAIDPQFLKSLIDKALEENILVAVQELASDPAWLAKVENLINQAMRLTNIDNPNQAIKKIIKQ